MRPPIAGLIGLAYKSIAQDAVDPLLDQMYQNGLIPANAVGLYINTDQQGNKGGVLTLGGAESSLYTGSLVTTPIVNKEVSILMLSMIIVEMRMFDLLVLFAFCIYKNYFCCIVDCPYGSFFF